VAVKNISIVGVIDGNGVSVGTETGSGWVRNAKAYQPAIVASRRPITVK
jgi:hypothetical protein